MHSCIYLVQSEIEVGSTLVGTISLCVKFLLHRTEDKNVTFVMRKSQAIPVTFGNHEVR